MYSNAEMQLAYKVANAPVNGFPYPHIYVPDVFPKDFYDQLQKALPEPEAMLPIGDVRPVKGYKERFVMELHGKQFETLPEDKKQFWRDFSGWLLPGRFMSLVLMKFEPYLTSRFKSLQGAEFYNESLLVEDVTKYALGPHTDARRKVITMLFYLPKDESQSHLGTSIYLPKDLRFTCPGGPHYGFENFQRLTTMPFLPNSLFAFVKTDTSFHGVEPVTDPDTRRWLLLYDIYLRQPEQQQAAAPAEQPQPANVSFSFS